MRIAIGAMIVVAAAARAGAAESVTVPWAEFRELYRASVEGELKRAMPPEKVTPLCSLDEADYRLKVGARSASGEVLVSGRVLAGEPRGVALFGSDVVIAAAREVKGGSLLASAGGVSFLPEGQTPFQVELSVLLPVGGDKRTRRVSLAVPPALRNSLRVELPAGFRLVEHPGIAGEGGVIHFAPGERMDLAFSAEPAEEKPRAPARVEVEALTLVSLRDGRAYLTTRLLSGGVPGSPVALRLPAGSRILHGQFSDAWTRTLAGGAVEMTLPPEAAGGEFYVHCALDAPERGGEVGVPLPTVANGAAKGALFVVDEPEDAEVTIVSEAPPSRVPVAELPAEIARLCAARCERVRIAPEGEVRLAVRRFEAVAAPEVVLDVVHFFTSFEETGGSLSVLRMDVPAGAGRRLAVGAVDGARIWSVKVNGRRRELYSSEGAGWVVPLDQGDTSRVEVAFLRRGEKLGLRGRLEAVLPATGLPARKVYFAAAIPERVELLSVEGEIARAPSARAASLDPPREFVGRPYLFQRSFHKGTEMKAAFLYREPVDDRQAAGEGGER